MYYLFREKNVMPGHFYRMPPGEKQLIRAFCEQSATEGKYNGKKHKYIG